MRQNRRFLITLAVALVVITAVIAMVSGLEKDKEQPAVLFPGLEAQLSEVDAVSIATRTEKVAVRRTDEGWVVSELDNYPAEKKRVHGLLLGLSGLRVVEAKTQNPDLYARVRLRDLDLEGSEATQVRLSKKGAPLGEILIGSQSPSRRDPSMAQVFVRRPQEGRVWLVEGRFDPLSAKPADWAQGELLSLDRARIYSAETQDPSSGQPIRVSRSPGERDFTLQDMPEGKKVRYQFAVNDVAASYAELRLDAVREGVPAVWERKSAAVMNTFDGLEVKILSYSGIDAATGGEGYWVTLEARAGTRAYSETEAVGGGELDTGEAIALKSEAEVEAEVDALNERWGGWRFRLPQVVYDRVFPKYDELLEDAVAEAAASEN